MEKPMKLFIYFLFTVLLSADSYPYFTKEDFIHIKKSAGNIAKNRANDYQKTIDSYKKIPKKKQLLKVNLYLNQLLPEYDDITAKKENYWATPKEFLITGYGDCEDYVIIKYFSLIKLGFDKEKLFFTTVYEQYNGGYHMVLSYFQHRGQSPLILDNLSFKILKLKERKDLKADLFINDSGIYKIDENNKLKKIQNSSIEFEDLIRRIKKEN